MTYLARHGFLGGDVRAIADMDLLSFDAACGSMVRVLAAERAEFAWTVMIAAQGRQVDMTRWSRDRWIKPALGQKDDSQQFIADLAAAHREST